LVHSKVLEKYKDANMEYNISIHANDMNEENFFAKVKTANKGPAQHYIIKIVRVKFGGKEYVYYHETLRAKDFLNNMIDHTRVVGTYEDPQFMVSVDPKTNTPRATEVQGHETIYEWPWTPNIVDQWLSQENFHLDPACGFIVKDYSRTYGGYTYEQFCENTYEDLVTLGKYGTLEPKTIAKRVKERASKTQESSE
jgi:hypothetical protein